MKHPDWHAFLASIVAEPDDDTLRLVAADFLEENGEPERAGFIRVQVALAQLDLLAHSHSPEGEEFRRNGQLELDELRKKERAFLGPFSVYPHLWAAEDCPELVRVIPPVKMTSPLASLHVEGAERLRWHRGFVERIDCPAAEWLRHGVAVRKRNPVREVLLHTCFLPTRGDWYAGLDALRGLRRVWLDLYSTQHRDGDFAGWLRAWLPETVVVASSF